MKCMDKMFSKHLPGRQGDDKCRFSFSDLIDKKALKQMMDSFFITTGIFHGFYDLDNKIIASRGRQGICSDHSKAGKDSETWCQQSCKSFWEHSFDGPYPGYKCENGLMMYAAPVLVDGRKLATFFIGQILHESPDENEFRQQAKLRGCDEQLYWEAASKIPVVSKNQIFFYIKCFTQVVGLLADLGLERMRLQEQSSITIKENEQNYRLALEGISDGFWHWDIKAGKVRINRQLASLLELGSEEIIMSFDSWVQFIHPHDSADTLKLLNEHLEQKSSRFEAEHRMLVGPDKYLWILSRGKVQNRDSHGRPLRMVGACFDISKRKKMENALRISEEKFAKAFNASPITMCITTLDEGRILVMNESLCRTLGYERNDIKGRTSMEIGFWLNPDDRKEIVRKLMEEGSVHSCEINFCRSKGEKRLGLYSAEKLDIEGVDCILTILEDITERRQMEIDMLRMDRLNIVGEMAASIGHEIRNPMTSIRGFLQMFAQKYNEDQEFLNIMIGELDRANLIITEFLTLAKNKIVELVPSDLNFILENMSPLMKANAAMQEKHLLLEMEEIPPLLLDSKEIRQLLLNLVNNGLEAMPAGGRITIKTYLEGEEAVLAVADEGTGIDSECYSKLGTPFYTTKENGTGLGLPICYTIAARHNARIEVDTSPRGTTFRVHFPRYKNLSLF